MKRRNGKIYESPFDGRKVIIPRGYCPIDIDGETYFQNGHGVIYQLCYMFGCICLETVNGWADRWFPLEEVES